jgi:hypothetical protein
MLRLAWRLGRGASERSSPAGKLFDRELQRKVFTALPMRTVPHLQTGRKARHQIAVCREPRLFIPAMSVAGRNWARLTFGRLAAKL